ncbi:MAG TPA: ABC transporter permease, partial [Bryobacterales bacterium]|nr:ABC transporter permease [Bryobacterales bacterium]
MLGKNRAFTLVTALTLALGIGANTAMFSVADALLLRPLPYGHPERLMLVYAWKAGAAGPFSLPRFEFLRDHGQSFAAIAAFTSETFNLSRRGDPEQLPSARVSWNFFDALGVSPALGRSFRSEEDQAGGRQVVLISSRLWAERFGRQPDIIGQSITLDSRDYTVIGVLPAGFEFSPLGADIDIWAPRVFDLNLITPARARAGTGFLNAVARLRPDVKASQAQAEMDVLNQQYRREFPKMPDADPGLTIVAGKLQERVVANVRPALLILAGAVGFLLLIACANVASLLLSRALGRRREIAVRAALGASRGAVMRQLLTESVALAAMGGTLGALLSAWGTRALSALLQGNLPRAREIAMDGRVLAFTAALSLLTGLLFGLIPALHLSKPDLNTVLRGESRGSIGSAGRSAMRNLLVVTQVALSMVLLIGSGLLIRSFARLQEVNAGFDPRNLLTMNIALAPAKY